MTLRRLAALTASLALCLTVADGADTGKEQAPYGDYVANKLSFDALKLGVATRINDLRADGANRVWAATDKGVAAILIDKLAPFFPLTAATDGILGGGNVAAVAFGTLGDAATGKENFFLGYDSTQGASGIQFGQVLADTGLQPKPPNLLTRNVSGQPNFVNAISALAPSGDGNLWAATGGGLVQWTLAGKTSPESVSTVLLGTPGTAVTRVATDPWSKTPATVYAAGGALFTAPSETSFDSLDASVVGLAFDGARTLWVATSQQIFRYGAGADPTGPYQTRAGPFGLPSGLREIRSIAVDPLNAAGTVVWVGTDQGAFFQVVDPATGDLTDAWVTAATTNPTTDLNVRVYVDPSGNVWLGSSFGVRSLLSRLVTLSSTRFVGYGAQAVITLLDVNPNAPGPPATPPPDTLPIFILKKGGAIDQPELTLSAARQPDNTYRASFAFAPATVEGKALGVTSSNTDVVFEVAYQFGPEGSKRELPRPAFSWANIVPFEDGAFIKGPCFLNALGH